MSGYKFNMIDSQLDGGADDGKADIFASGGSSAGSGGPSADQSAPGAIATSSSGGGPSSSNGGPAPAAQSAPKPSSSGGGPQGVSSGLRNAASKVALPTEPFQKIGSDISSADQKLQDSANAYEKKASDTGAGYGLDDATLEGAAGGDQAAYQKTAERLSKASADPFESFAGLGADTPSSANKLLDPSSIYRDSGAQNYTSGQARLDSALLRGNPEFTRIQQQLLGDQTNLAKKSDQMAIDETKKGQDTVNTGFKTSTDAIRGGLSSKGDQLVASLKAQEAAEDARRGGLDPAKIAAAERAKVISGIKEDSQGFDPNSLDARSLKYLDDPSDIDLSGLVNVDRDTDWHEFAKDADAQRFNRIHGLLGDGGEVLAAGQGPGADYTFDHNNAVSRIMGIERGKRQAQDRSDQDTIDSIIGYGKNANDQYAKDARAKYSAPGFDVNPYLQDLGSGLDDAAAAKANALYQDMGLSTRLSASPNRDALMNAYKAYQNSQAQAAPAGPQPVLGQGQLQVNPDAYLPAESYGTPEHPYVGPGATNAGTLNIQLDEDPRTYLRSR